MRLRGKIARIFLVFVIFFVQIPTYQVIAGASFPIPGFNQESIDMDSAYWDLTAMDLVGNELQATGLTASAGYVIDVTSIAQAIDQGGLEINFSADAYIEAEADADLDEASITIGFGSASSSPATTTLLERGIENPGSSLSLTSAASIPLGTRYIFIQPASLGQGDTNTAVFSALSLSVNDLQDPTLEYALSPSGWTNGDVQVTLTASDGDSGIEGIYDAENTKISSSAVYAFTTSSNNSWTFTTKDYAGKTSDVLTVTVDQIDLNAPSTPTLTVDTSDWSDQHVGFTISDSTAPSGEAPESRQYRLNGGDWQAYAEPAYVELEGESTLEARTVDEAGNASGTVSDTVKIDLSAPQITLSAEAHAYPTNGATVTAPVTDANSGVQLTKYAAGSQTAAYFSGAGTVFTGSTFNISSGGTYTVYAVDKVGHAAVSEITVNTYPTMDTMTDQSLNEDGTLTLTFSIGDDQTAAGDLVVTAVSSNTDIFPGLSPSNTGGVVSLLLLPAVNQNGDADVTVNVRDGAGLVSSQTFTVTVNPVNDDPTASNDTATTDEDTPLTIDVLANDSDIDAGDTLTISASGGDPDGTVEIINEGSSIRFSPAANWNGSTSFTYTIKDSGDATATATVSVTVNPVDDAPLISELADQTIDEDGDTGDLNFTVTDQEGDSLVVTAASGNTTLVPDINITVTDLGGGSYTISAAPEANLSGVAVITVTAGDGVKTSTESFTLTVTAVNDAPLAVADSASTDEDTPVVISVLVNDSDIEGESLSVTALGAASHGTVQITDSGQTVTYTPESEYNGSDTFEYTVSDTSGGTQTASVSVTINSVPDDPYAANDEVSSDEDTTLTVYPMTNDGDADIALNSDSITISQVTGELYGTVVLAGDGLSFTYTPNANSVETEHLTYTIKDSTDRTATAVVTITINPQNDGPSAQSDSVTTDEDTPVTISVLTNDLDVDLSREGDTLLISSVGTVNHGSVDTINEHTQLRFTPDDNWNGETSFTYTIHDKENITSTATVTVTVNAVNDAPVISEVTDQTIDEDGNTGALSFTVNDVEGDVLTVSAAGNNDDLIPAGCISLTDEGGGNYILTITPLENKNGSAVVTISAEDASDTTTETFTLTVNAVNDAPVGNTDTVSTDEDTPLEISVLSNDKDVENEELTVTAVSTAGHGSLEITGANKTVTYTPAENYNGSDTFTYTVSDATGDSGSGTVDVTVNSINDPPSAKADSKTLDEDIVTTIDVLANDTDIDLTTNPAYEALTITAVSDPPHGSTVISENKVVYTPDANYFGSDSFTYTLQDTDGVESTATVSLTIKSVNDYPAFSNLNTSYTVNEDESITFHFDISDVETPTESLMLQVVSQDQNIVSDSNMVLAGLGDSSTDTTLTVSPNLNKNQDVIIKLILGDGFATTQANFILDIVPVNDAPVPEDDEYGFVEDNSITIDMDDLVDNDEDIDGDTLSFVEVVAGSLGQGTLTELDAVEHTYTYTPPANFDGVTTFQYTMTDSTVQRNATVTLTAQPVNDTPVLTLDSGNPTAFDEDHSETLYFTIYDYETAISNLAVQAGSSDSDLVSPDHITINCDAAGACSMTLTPGEDQNGSVTISLSLSDGVILVQEDIPLTINPVQDDPVASADSLTVESGGTITFSPLENDHDADGDTIAIQSLSTSSTLGSVVNNGDNTLTYTAPTGTSGSDSFTYTINDGNGHTDSAAVTITISGGNSPPQITGVANQYINEDAVTAAQAFSVSDSDIGSTLTVTKVSSDLTLVPEGNITVTDLGSNNYTVRVSPAANQAGVVTITLTVTDNELATDSTSFTVTVYPINDLPVAVDDSLTVNEDNALTFSAADLLANDEDVDAGTVLQITNVTDPSHGRLTYSGATGNYTYQPDGNYNGTDSLEYTVTDGESTDTATVNITIVSVNDNPVAYSNWWTVAGSLGATYNGDIRTNDYDIETADENLTVTIVSDPTYGTAVVESDGTVTYTRDATSYSPDWKDSFTYRVSDDSVPAGVSGIATVYIDDYWGPSIYGDSQWFSMDEDHVLNMTLAIHDGYGEGYTVSFPSATLGTITDTDDTDKYITYTPDENVYGSESITYTLVSNSTGNPTGSGTFHVTIYPINDAPVISPALPDLTIDEDNSTSTLHVDISDVETAAADLIFTVSSSNSDLVLDSGISISRSGGSIDFIVTPLANRFGDTTITLLASDNAAQTTESFVLTVSPVNDEPVADDLNESTNEDNPLTITVVSPNADMDGDTLTVTTTVDPEHGSLLINPDNTITYTPALNYFGADSFTYQLADAEASDTGLVSLTVNAVNDPPEISNLVYNQNTLEDTPKTVTFKIADVDNSLSSANVTVVADNTTLLPAGSIVIAGSGTDISVTLTPAANLSGTSIQTVTLSDGMYSVSQDFKLIVAAVNDIPLAVNDAAETDEDTTKIFNVTNNDSDVESATLTVVAITDPPNGSVVNNRDGTLTYTPDENWNGTDTFTYTISDANNGQASATVTMTVHPVNDPPVAVKDTTTILEDNPVTLNLLANDTDIEGSPLTLTGVNAPSKGTFINNGDGSITYTPNANQYGTDTFTYTVSDGDMTSTGTVTINITPVNDPPEFSTSEALPWTLYEDVAKSFPITITDPETASDNLVVKITSSDQTLVPDTSISLSGSGQNKFITLSPLLNKYGLLDLTIEVSDGANTTTDVYAVEVLSVNDLPTISSIANQTIDEDTSTESISFTLTDIETAAAVLTVTAATDDGVLIPAENVVVTNGAGGNRTVVLTPAENKVGSSLITLTVHDADGGATDRTFTLTVNPVNDPPTAVADTGSVNEDSSVVLNVLSNDIDVDLLNESDNLTIVSIAEVNNATVNIAFNKKTLTFIPDANWNGEETFTYTMKDSAGETSSASVTVTVIPQNDDPVANDDSITTPEDTPITIFVLANDTDIDLSRETDDLTIIETSGVDNGSVTIAEDKKSLVFSPADNWNGDEEFTYTIKDSHGATDSATVTVTVSPVNDPPQISDIADQTLTEDTASSAISFTVSDVETPAASLTITAATSDGLIIPLSHIVLGGTDGTRTVVITPAAEKNTWNPSLSTHEPLTLTITVSDGELTADDTFLVTINPANDGPVADDDIASTDEDTPVTVYVLANDSDVDIDNEGDDLTVTSVSGVDNGAVEIAVDGKSLTFTPAADYYGSETFTYTVKDSHEVEDTADVTVTVSPVNDAPILSEIADQSIDEDSTTGALAFTITDVDNTLTCADVSATSDTTAIIPVANVVIAGSGTVCTVAVTPLNNKNTSGASPVTITLSITDGFLSDSETFAVVIAPQNDPPTAMNDAVTVLEDHSAEIDVLANDTDNDLANEGDTLVVLSTSGVEHGTVSIDPVTYILTFTPDANWFGVETFTYLMEDSTHATSSASVTVTVNVDNDTPQAVDDSATVVEDGSVEINVLANDTDVDIGLEGDELFVYAYADVDNGTVTIADDKKTLTFAPKANWVGTETFSYTIRDLHNAESTANVTVTVTAVNDAPTAVDDTFTSPEDQTATLNVLGNDMDVDLSREGDTLIVLSVSGALHGTASVSSDQESVIYIPDENWNGDENLTYYMEDKEHQVSFANVSLHITAVNDPPQAVNDTGTVDEDSSITLTVLNNDTDIDLDDILTIVSTDGVDHGTVVIVDNKLSLTFTPAADWNGSEVFTYTMKDSAGATSSASVTITVTPLNDPPDAVDDSVTTPEDQAVTISALNNDTDVDLTYGGDNLIITGVSGVDHGTAVISSDQQTITFTPSANWSGSEFFTYEMKDRAGLSDTATVTVVVSPVNDAPVAAADSYTIDEDVETVLDVLVNDTDNDTGDKLTVTGFSGVDNATVTLAADHKSLTFKPDANWNGSETFTYTLEDGAGASDTASVTVLVNAVNDVPLAQDDSASTNEDTSVVINVLENDSDVDTLHEGDSLTLTAVTDLDNATYSFVNDNHSIRFTPNENWNGVEIFSYTVSDLHGGTATASVTVTVAPQNDASTAFPDSAACLEDGSVEIDVLDNDVDIDFSYERDNLIVVAVADVDHGTAVIASDSKSVIFTPLANWNGSESFTYTIRDNGGATSSALVTVTVTPQNDAPTAIADTASTDEDVAVEIDVLANDTDIDLSNEGDDLFITGISGTYNGSVSIAPDQKTLTYTPPANWYGSEIFTYSMKDRANSTSSAQVTVSVQSVDDAPVISAVGDQTISEDTLTGPISFTLTDIDSLVDDITVSATSSSQSIVSNSGIITGGSGASRTVSITPILNKNTYVGGPLVITIHASSASATGTATFNLTITPVNDNPKAVTDIVSMYEDTSAMISPLDNDTDIDLQNEGDNLTIISTAGVDNGTLTIINSGKNLLFTPNTDWFGIEEFTYTLQDQAGVQSTASVFVSVIDVAESSAGSDNPVITSSGYIPPHFSFEVLSPYPGEQYRDGSSVLITWTSLNIPGVTYTVEFFDGEEWIIVATGLTGHTYSHDLENTHLHTDQALYRVTANAGSTSMVLAQSQPFIIDNEPPRELKISLTELGGAPYINGAHTNQPVLITVGSGYDLTGVTIRILDDGKVIISGSGQITVKIDTPGIHHIQIIAVDPLGNISVIAEYTIVIDSADSGSAGDLPAPHREKEGPSPQLTGGGIPLLPVVGGGLFGLILLVLLLWPNVKIVYFYRLADGSLRKVVRRTWAFKPRDGNLRIKVKDADAYEVTLGRGLTRSVRGGSLTIQPENSTDATFNAPIPKDTLNRFKTDFKEP